MKLFSPTPPCVMTIMGGKTTERSSPGRVLGWTLRMSFVAQQVQLLKYMQVQEAHLLQQNSYFQLKSAND